VDGLLIIDNCQSRIIKKTLFVLVIGNNGEQWGAVRVRDVQKLKEIVGGFLSPNTIMNRLAVFGTFR
jgi:hypothetical protein